MKCEGILKYDSYIKNRVNLFLNLKHFYLFHYSNINQQYNLAKCDIYYFQKNIDNLEEKAKQGSSLALGYIGMYHYNYKHYPSEMLKAIEYFEKGAIKNDLISLYMLGIIKKDFNLMSRAAERNYLPAIYLLGELYESGIGVQENKDKAKEYYQIAVSRGYAAGYLGLNNLEKASDLGVCFASYKLALKYEENGDYEKAFALMKKSVDDNDELDKKKYAHYRLGYYYEKGIGTERNLPSAFRNYTSAINKGFEYIKLTNFARYSHVSDKDLWIAYSRIKENSDPAINDALERLIRLCLDKKNMKKDFEKSFFYSKVYSKTQDPNGYFHLGYHYYYHLGTKKNVDKAIKYWLKAHDKSAKACIYLAKLYSEEEGYIDFEKALKFIRKTKSLEGSTYMDQIYVIQSLI